MNQAPTGRSAEAAGQRGAESTPAANRILAIDGPAGAGKSTIAARMAEQFGLLKIETGAMYRAFALKALEADISLDDGVALTHLSEQTRIELLPATDTRTTGNRVLLDGEDVTVRLRTTAISEAASRVSVHGPVRAWMVGLQQALGRSIPQGIVMEGRDIGTVVFPDASVKIFLSASAEARTERRLAQEGPAAATGREQADAEGAAALLAAIRERDERDRSRAESPLRPADDAVEIDSTELTLDQVVAKVATLVAERWHAAPSTHRQ